MIVTGGKTGTPGLIMLISDYSADYDTASQAASDLNICHTFHY